MSQTNSALRIVTEPADQPAWVGKLFALLDQAAELAVRNSLPTDEFMSAAWKAVVTASPDLRDELADRELRAQLKKLRRQGLIGQA